jgi:hypothetical protein
MQPPNKTPRKAGGLAQGVIGFRHSEHALITKETAPHQDEATPTTPAGVYLCQRFCIRPVIADLVASLAGLGPDRRAA